MFTGLFPGSTFKYQLDTAKGLSKERDAEGNPLYDVSIIVAKENNRVKESATLHKIEIPIHVDDIVLEGKGKSPKAIIESVAKI